MQKNHKKSIEEIIEEIKSYPKNEGLKLVHLKYTFEDWKGGTFGGMKFDSYVPKPDYYTMTGEGNLYFVEVPQEVAAQILNEQKKIYHKTVEDLALKFIAEFHRQHQMRGNGQTLLNREIEELEKLFFEEKLPIKESIEVIEHFNFNTVVSFMATSERTKYADWQIKKFRRIHDKKNRNKRYRGTSKTEWYEYVKPDNNTDLGKGAALEIRIEALDKYRLHLIGFEKGEFSPSQPFIVLPRVAPEDAQSPSKQAAKPLTAIESPNPTPKPDPTIFVPTVNETFQFGIPKKEYSEAWEVLKIFFVEGTTEEHFLECFTCKEVTKDFKPLKCRLSPTEVAYFITQLLEKNIIEEEPKQWQKTQTCIVDAKGNRYKPKTLKSANLKNEKKKQKINNAIAKLQ